jgi:nucleoside-diphosphate-sugar epimerase
MVAPADAGIFRRVNFEGTARLVEASLEAGVRRFVLLSSVKAMGTPGDERADEGTPARPSTPYGESKKAAEDLVLGTRGIPHVSVVRASPVYGAGSKGNLSRMIAAMARGVFPPVPDTGNVRSMVHVDDLADALILCAENRAAERRLFIVTDGRDYSTRQIYEWVCESMGRKPPRWSIPPAVFHAAGRIGDALGRVTGRAVPFNGAMVERLLGSASFDSTLAARSLGFSPRWDLERALPEMVRELSNPRGSDGR